MQPQYTVRGALGSDLHARKDREYSLSMQRQDIKHSTCTPGYSNMQDGPLMVIDTLATVRYIDIAAINVTAHGQPTVVYRQIITGNQHQHHRAHTDTTAHGPPTVAHRHIDITAHGQPAVAYRHIDITAHGPFCHVAVAHASKTQDASQLISILRMRHDSDMSAPKEENTRCICSMMIEVQDASELISMLRVRRGSDMSVLGQQFTSAKKNTLASVAFAWSRIRAADGA
eukprot:1048219-Pelagomonas_calceolata.AAC.1